jgi:hypothetical protein
MAMARKVIVELADDIDGSEASQTVRFAVGGVEYEIDLSDANAAAFDKAFSPFVAHARRVSHQRSAGRAGGTPDGIDPRAVRVWAAQRGITLGPRGRIPLAIVEQYRGDPG